MTISTDWPANLPEELRKDVTDLEAAYFRHIDSESSAPPSIAHSDRIFGHHLRLGTVRLPGASLAKVHRPNDSDGLGAAIQAVNDDMPLLVESVVSTLQRLGAVVTEVIHPIFGVVRDDGGLLRTLTPRDENNGHTTPRESWMHVQLSASTSDSLLDRIEAAIPALLADLHQIFDDTDAMSNHAAELADRLDALAGHGDSVDGEDIADRAALLRWLLDGHFTMLGYAHYECSGDNADRTSGRRALPESLGGDLAMLTETPDPTPNSGLGLLHPGSTAGLRVPTFSPSRPPLLLTQATVGDSVGGSVYPYLIGVAETDANNVVGYHLFAGLFTPTALHEHILDIPVVKRRVRRVIEWAGFDLNSFSGLAMLEVMQQFPRVELFSSDARRLFETASAVLNLDLRRNVRLFLRQDAHSHIVSCLVYLPRDRYTTAVRLSMQNILRAEFGGEHVDFSARATESDLANIYYTVRRPDSTGPADISETNRQRIQELLIATSRTWADRLTEVAASTRDVDPVVAKRYADAFPSGYQQDFTPTHALTDLRRLERLSDGTIDVHLYRRPDAAVGDWRFTLYVGGAGVTLSRVLPVLHSLGLEVLDERPYRIELPDGLSRWIYDLRVRARPELLANALDQGMEAALVDTDHTDTATSAMVRQRFSESFEAMWFDRAETDGLNELVLRAGLTWREISVLRAYGKYLRQAGFAYSQANIARVLVQHPDAARAFVALFAARFDPDAGPDSRSAGSAPEPDSRSAGSAPEPIELELRARIDAVVSLDTDRILRAILGLINATLRTNYYLVDADGAAPECFSFKVNPREIDLLPKPRPQFEIFVYSPRVEGVHLRFGRVARGGLRWSDRLEDFRTEVLGLVKAQAVKNAVIVPVGAKGGFVVKRPPAQTGDAVADRQAILDEGVACYRLFISGLLDLTDNIDHVTGAVLPPPRVVRHDGDDTYLVVAADKGTATFSDIANDVAARYKFWLGDAFASGGSAGYDHKQMAITAQGAWESVKRHFREMDVDVATENFTVVGIGDMSGDVFGNGMLLSEHIRLVAAFDHRHIFIDPDPDPATSFRERARLFALPRSSWADYDTALIGPGGGVWDRTTKSIPVSARIRAALGLAADVTTLSPPEMVRAILLAPVDLLWNGGIGTYVKASIETNAEAGDKSNDPVRVNGNQIRAKVIGEGGNLGATALGRIEFCRAGGRINTDALDNSAGVDCSDHEVNIKVLLDGVVSAGELAAEARNDLLASMTDEVAQLVLADNISQNYLMGLSRADAIARLTEHRAIIADLEANNGLDRELEALPSDAEIARRSVEGTGLTSPELANLMAHVKLALKADLLAGDLPDSTSFTGKLTSYFPTPLRERFGPAINAHPLRRQIVATMLANDTVDLGGLTYKFRLAQETGASTDDAVRAFAAAVEIFDLRSLWQRIRAEQMPTAVRDELELETKRTLHRASRWLLRHRPQPLAIGAGISRYSTGVHKLAAQVPDLMKGHQLDDVALRSRSSVEHGAPPMLAMEVFRLVYMYPLLDVLDIADIIDRDAAKVAELHYALSEQLHISRLLTAVRNLERGDRWHSLARLAVRDDLYSSLRSLTLNVLKTADPDETAPEQIAYWESTSRSQLARVRAALTEIFATGAQDLATLSVAAGQIRSMAGGANTQPELAASW